MRDNKHNFLRLLFVYKTNAEIKISSASQVQCILCKAFTENSQQPSVVNGHKTIVFGHLCCIAHECMMRIGDQHPYLIL